jgi:hypothetical protein
LYPLVAWIDEVRNDVHSLLFDAQCRDLGEAGRLDQPLAGFQRFAATLVEADAGPTTAASAESTSTSTSI